MARLPMSRPIDQVGSLKLNRTSRLRKPAEFQRVYNNKQWGNAEHFSFNAAASDTRRLGVTVSKKVSKKAVDRNRIKRQIREFYRLRQHDLISSELVITAKPSCLMADDSSRADSLEVLWQKILKWQRWYLKTSNP